MADHNQEAERAAPMDEYEAIELLRDALEHYNRLAPNTITAREALRLTANVVRRTTSSAVVADDLGPLPAPTSLDVHFGFGVGECLYPASQVGQIRRDAVEADRRARAPAPPFAAPAGQHGAIWSAIENYAHASAVYAYGTNREDALGQRQTKADARAKLEELLAEIVTRRAQLALSSAPPGTGDKA